MNRPTTQGALTAVAIAAIVAVGSSARAEEPGVVAKVPFDFVVGTTHLPAGDYVVRKITDDGSIVAILNADGREAALTMTFPADADQAAGDSPKLVFDKINDEYVLARVMADDWSREIAVDERAASEHRRVAARQIDADSR